MSQDIDSPVAHSLRAVHLFSGIDNDSLAKIEQQCRWRSYARGQVLVDKGDMSRDVFFVTKGSAAAITYSPTGREVTLGILNTGDMFGELAAIDEKPRSATVAAIESAHVAILSAHDFQQLLRNNAEVAFHVLQRLTGIIRNSGARIMELATLQAAQRVYAELLRMATPDVADQGLWVIRPLPPMHEIASLTGTTRETVSRAISHMYSNNLLKRKGRNLFLMDRERLVEMVRGLEVHNSLK